MAANQTEANPATRYRIVAAEAHSWSSLLLEDERGRRYLYVVGTRALTRVSAGSAADLLARRAYRTWRGERSWAPLDRLPVYKLAMEVSPGTDVPVGLGDAQMAEMHE